jgi:hypothetical protein
MPIEVMTKRQQHKGATVDERWDNLRMKRNNEAHYIYTDL